MRCDRCEAEIATNKDDFVRLRSGEYAVKTEAVGALMKRMKLSDPILALARAEERLAVLRCFGLMQVAGTADDDWLRRMSKDLPRDIDWLRALLNMVNRLRYVDAALTGKDE